MGEMQANRRTRCKEVSNEVVSTFRGTLFFIILEQMLRIFIILSSTKMDDSKSWCDDYHPFIQING